MNQERATWSDRIRSGHWRLRIAQLATLLVWLACSTTARAADAGAAPPASPPKAAQPAPADGHPAAAAPSSAELFSRAAAALERGAFDRAIDELELLADRGYIHPDVSFNRGVAYLRRAETRQIRPGDYGRASAAFHEVLRLRPGDKEAARALSAVESHITRQRSREGRDPVVVTASLSRAVVGLASESVWAWLAALSAWICSVGLGLRLWSAKPRIRFSGGVAAAVACAALVVLATLAHSARRFRLESSPAVVVVAEARLLDAQGKPLPKSPELELEAVPEGALVWISERSGSLVRVEWGVTQGWLSASQLQPLASPDELPSS